MTHEYNLEDSEGTHSPRRVDPFKGKERVLTLQGNPQGNASCWYGREALETAKRNLPLQNKGSTMLGGKPEGSRGVLGGDEVGLNHGEVRGSYQRQRWERLGVKDEPVVPSGYGRAQRYH